jgi:hypothetical protein
LLVSYCIRSKIPLPRLANKSFRVESDFLALEFITSFSKAPEPESADSASRSVKWVLEATLPEPGGGLGR